MKKLWKKLKAWWLELRISWKIKSAERKHRMNNQQYHVFNIGRRLYIRSSRDIKALKREGKIVKSFNVFQRDCKKIYSTK